MHHHLCVLDKDVANAAACFPSCIQAEEEEEEEAMT